MCLKEYLKKLINNFTGNIIVIGIRDKDITDQIVKSKKINQCYFLNSETNEEVKKKKWQLGHDESISIKKFRRKFKKKKTSYIICNIKDIKSYLKYFIKDSVYICNDKIYYYGLKKDFDLTDMEKKYARYGATISTEKLKDYYIVIVDVKDAKYSRVKAFIYIIKDGFSRGCDILGDFLVH